MTARCAHGRIRTLIVEDDWLLRRATSLLLKAEPDIQVVGTAKNGAAALDKVEALEPDLVVTEIAMPQMGGLELAYLLRRRFPSLAIVVVGSVNGPEITELCGLCGADVLINKALLPKKLPAIVRIVFATRKQTSPPGGFTPSGTDAEKLPAEIVSGPTR